MSRQSGERAAMLLPWQFGMMMWQAQAVIAMRMMGLAGGWSLSPGEETRMVSEKAAAIVEGSWAAARAMARGAQPAEIAGAALRPVARRTKANMRRLTRRGPSFIGE